MEHRMWKLIKTGGYGRLTHFPEMLYNMSMEAI